MTSKRLVVLASAAPCTPCGEETVHGSDTREKPKIATTTARRAPLEFSASEEIWYRLTRPRRLPRIHLPRIPRPSARRFFASLSNRIPNRLKNSQGGRLAARHPGLTVWVMTFAAAVLVISGRGLVEPDFHLEPERYQAWLSRRGSRAVSATVAEIGPSVEIPAVRAKPIGYLYAAYYTHEDSAITFNSQHEYFEYELLDTAAHESVHAIIHQNGLQPNSTTHGDYFRMVNETTASVLGAYVAGNVWSRRGRDASIFTEVSFRSFRSDCDPANPDSRYSKYLAPGRAASGEFDRETWHAVLIHFGPLQLVDEVYQMCYLHSDPTEAAKRITQRFMRTDLAPRDRPILEEFERTRMRWDDEN